MKQEKPNGETLTTSAGSQYLAHEVIVKKSPGVSMSAFESAIEAQQGKLLKTESPAATNRLGFFRVILPKEVMADVVISRLTSRKRTSL